MVMQVVALQALPAYRPCLEATCHHPLACVTCGRHYLSLGAIHHAFPMAARALTPARCEARDHGVCVNSTYTLHTHACMQVEVRSGWRYGTACRCTLPAALTRGPAALAYFTTPGRCHSGCAASDHQCASTDLPTLTVLRCPTEREGAQFRRCSAVHGRCAAVVLVSSQGAWTSALVYQSVCSLPKLSMIDLGGRARLPRTVGIVVGLLGEDARPGTRSILAAGTLLRFYHLSVVEFISRLAGWRLDLAGVRPCEHLPRQQVPGQS